jgi:hypothetical protein
LVAEATMGAKADKVRITKSVVDDAKKPAKGEVRC